MTDKNTLVLQRCTDARRVEHCSSSETSVRSSDVSNEVITIKVEGEELHIKEEAEPIAISCSSIKDVPEVSPQTFHQYLRLPSVIMLYKYCLPAFPHKSAPCGEWKYRVSQEEQTKVREGVPYVKLYRYNPKHLYPKLNGYGDNGK